jgi:FtsZ-interacting cell division protein YlmF
VKAEEQLEKVRVQQPVINGLRASAIKNNNEFLQSIEKVSKKLDEATVEEKNLTQLCEVVISTREKLRGLFKTNRYPQIIKDLRTFHEISPIVDQFKSSTKVVIQWRVSMGTGRARRYLHCGQVSRWLCGR